MTSDEHDGIVRAVCEIFSGQPSQRCVVHLERNVIDACTTGAKRIAVCVLHAVFGEDVSALADGHAASSRDS